MFHVITALPCAIAMSDYYAAASDEISFRERDIIEVVQRIDDGWIEGRLQDGSVGMVPANYVEMGTPLLCRTLQN